MHWFIIALIPPLLWAITNHIDKYLVSKFFKQSGIGALVILASGVQLVLVIVLVVVSPEVLQLDIHSKVLLIIGGTLNALAVIPYYYALQDGEASAVVPMFQLIPVMSLMLGFLVLGETITTIQFWGMVLVLIGSLVITKNFGKKEKGTFKFYTLVLMALSSLMYAANTVVFKFVALEHNFWTTKFWETLGFVFIGILVFMGIPAYRKQCVSALRMSKRIVLGLNALNEAISTVAFIIFNFATLLVPLVLVWTVNGLQSFFVFIIGLILAWKVPSISSESLQKKDIIQKVIAILIMFMGTYLINN